jgi:glutamate synthase (ferredoxin)
MYQVSRNGKTILEADACGIGFVVSRKGVPDRTLVDAALEFSACFDHRGAPGHGAGMQLDIPWPLLIERFADHRKLIAQRDVALATFFLPFESNKRRQCVAAVEALAITAGAPVLQWEDVPINLDVLPANSNAHRLAPKVRQAILMRPPNSSADEWFACRYLLRLALDDAVRPIAGDEFTVVSLSNRTVVYKGLVELSKLADLYPDLRNPDFASRFACFHSRYSTNTSTAWRRAQPFWALAHNGEINTIKGNVAWMEAIGKDLIRKIVERYPALEPLAAKVDSVVCRGGSDTANLDDMLIALMAGGMSLSQSILALLPEATSNIPESSGLRDFYRAMNIFLGACDGPAAVVACDGDEAIAHLDRNGLRPLWVATTKDYAVAASELTGSFPLGKIEMQKLLGPGESVCVKLKTGEVLTNEAVHADVSRKTFTQLFDRVTPGESTSLQVDSEELLSLQTAFGMTREDVDVILSPMGLTGKPPVGSMGDDTSPSALLDHLPRRIEDYFSLRFAQETSPPIDPIRDSWVFDTSVAIGDRSGLWDGQGRSIFTFPDRILSVGQTAWLEAREGTAQISLLFDAEMGADGLEARLSEIVEEAANAVDGSTVLILTDQGVSPRFAAVPMLRAISRVHTALVRRGLRHRVGLVADTGAWDIHHCALLVALGADAVCPWLGSASVGDHEANYLKGLRAGLLETMSMMGVTPSSAYCGARLIEAIGLDAEFLEAEFADVPGHLSGIGASVLNEEWLAFHGHAFAEAKVLALVDAGEYRHSKEGRPHANNAEIVRSLHSASGYAKKIHNHKPGSWEAYGDYSRLVSERTPITLLDCIQIRSSEPVPIEEVESVESILWRFMAPGMSEGALSEPAHRTIAAAMNLLNRYCRFSALHSGATLPGGLGPFANSGEGGFSKERIGKRDGNTSVQYAGGRFTITPMTAARALEAEIKFAQGAKPGKGGQLPGKKVTEKVAKQRGCEPGYELVSPPINHNLYSIEDVKLMLESWRHLNPAVNCSLKYVATYGVEMVAIGGVNAGANRLHLSDGCGGTGAAKRVDQKHAGVPTVALLPTVQDLLVEDGVRHLVELSVDGGVQNGEQALKLMLLGADRIGFGTSLLIAIGCSMLRKCHLAGPDPADPSGKRRLGCTPGIATQDPLHVARFTGKPIHIARYLRYVAREIRELMAEHGIRSLSEVVGRRDFLERKPDLHGKAALIRFDSLLNAPHLRSQARDYELQTRLHMPKLREREAEGARRALEGEKIILRDHVTNADRCVGMRAAGEIARAVGDLGLDTGTLILEHEGAAGHFFGAYLVDGMECRLLGIAADSAFTASYGGKLTITPSDGNSDLTVVGNTFGYGARGGSAYIAGRGGNRFGICFRKGETGGPRVVVEGVEANAFQYMTGGVALVLGSVGPNLGSGMTGGCVFLLDASTAQLNSSYVKAEALQIDDAFLVRSLLDEHARETGSALATCLLRDFEPSRFTKVTTCVIPEKWDS